MEDHDKSKDQLIQELHSLRQLVADFKDPLFVAQNAARQYDDSDRLVYEDLPLGYQSLDENGFFLEVNPAWLTTMGYSRQQVIGKWFGDFLAPGYQDHFKVNFPKFKAAGEIHGVEFEMVRRDGSVISVMFDGQIGRDSTGRFKQTHCILQDVTERRSAEVALRESEERFRILVETMHEGVGIRDKNGLVVYANDRLAEMVGYPKDQILGHDVTEFLDDANKQILHQYSDALRNGGYSPYEVEVVRGDGQKMSMTVSGKPIYGRDGLLKGTFAVMMDITARKRAEEALRNSEQMLGSILATCPVGIGMAQDRVMKWVNDAWVKMFGLENEQEGMNLNARALYPSQEEFERVGRELYEGLETGKVTGTDTKFRRQDGSVFEAHIRMQLVDTEGPEKVTIAAITDISDRKRHEEELNRSHNKLTSILESISDAFFVLDNDMVVTYFNEVAERLLGKPRQEVLGQKLFDAFSEARCSISEEKYTMALREKVSVSFETYFEVPPYVNWYDVRVYPQPQGISVYFQVTTERKLKEEALRQSEEKFRFLTEAMVDIVWTMDLNLRFTYVSPSVERVLGFTREERLRQRIEEQITPESLARIRDTLAGELEQERTGDADPDRHIIIEVENYKKGGGTIWLENIVKAIRDSQGMMIGLHGLSRDITQRREIEESLRESEERFRGTFELSMVGKSLTDPDGKLTRVNQAFADMLGYTIE
ncbi:MAG: two-component system, cell cycle sensor histidine kinase and response regulator CckA, partial [Thermodesulfobacteriota bacterium]|nr:two-component system, cell cycle sensor histidine kinase and response regulator CckA [Thermodesulfobacteriota bacterium]